MNAPAIEPPQIHLKPGELLITREPCLVVTVLGSCVAITMFNARFRLAAICHALLPDTKTREGIEPGHSERFRYLRFAVPAMTEAFRRAGLQPREIEVKLFGGANTMRALATTPPGQWVGRSNITAARRLLREAHLHLAASNVGGTGGRKLLFHTATGEVWHKHLT